MSFNPALNTDSLPSKAAPPPLNALYLRDGIYDGMERRNIADTFDVFRKQSKPDRLALFFHGGLVDKASGQRSAAAEYDAYSDVVFPLFFIWESGAGEVLAHHLPLIFAETIFGRVVAHATQLIAGKSRMVMADFGIRDERWVHYLEPSALTAADVEAFTTAIREDEEVQHEAFAIAKTSVSTDALLGSSPRTRSSQLSSRSFLSPDVVSSIRGAVVQADLLSGSASASIDAIPFGTAAATQAAWAVAKAANPVIINCFKRFSAKRDHGITCTIVEEVLRALYLANFGSSIWEEMKRETEDAFGPNSDKCGGTAVVEELCSLFKQNPNHKVTLVGHSTGGVYIGNFLRHIDAALLQQGDSTTTFDVILMAPANTVDFFATAYTSRVAGIRIFQMDDATEQEDHLMSRDAGPDDPSLLGKIYPRSLLYLVAGVCEYFQGQSQGNPHALDGYDMPILGMDRYPSEDEVFPGERYPHIGLIRRKFSASPQAEARKYVRVLSPTPSSAPDGYRSQAMKHGDFPRDPETINSIRVCFQSGL